MSSPFVKVSVVPSSVVTETGCFFDRWIQVSWTVTASSCHSRKPSEQREVPSRQLESSEVKPCKSGIAVATREMMT